MSLCWHDRFYELFNNVLCGRGTLEAAFKVVVDVAQLGKLGFQNAQHFASERRYMDVLAECVIRDEFRTTLNIFVVDVAQLGKLGFQNAQHFASERRYMDVLAGCVIRDEFRTTLNIFVVDVAQLVEPRIVIPVVAGSSPVIHPILFFKFLLSLWKRVRLRGNR